MSATTKEQPTPQTTPTKDPVDKNKVKLFVVKIKWPKQKRKGRLVLSWLLTSLCLFSFMG